MVSHGTTTWPLPGHMVALSKYSMGVGDRFGLEGQAQLRAFQAARERGVDITPVWNKSNREHSLIGTRPEDVRAEADAAVKACGWDRPYLVDADHIGLGTVDRFMQACDFFTIDVADAIGQTAPDVARVACLEDMQRFVGEHRIPGITDPLLITPRLLSEFTDRYLAAVAEAGRVYRHIALRKGEGRFVTEISFDEASTPQTPGELFLILAAVAREKIPVETVAPKFTGEFLKGIDYVGDRARFAKEFAEDVAVLAFAKQSFALPASLKLSVHSGSDKFSLYPLMRRTLVEANAGVHLKTAGTTWLEEVLGLAQADGDGLAFAKALYREAFARYDEMAKPYLTVIAIDRQALPSPAEVDGWTGRRFVEALEHDQTCPRFSIHFRQLVHISFRIAAEKRSQYLDLLRAHRAGIDARVYHNILRRHIEPLFLGIA
jgi:tagaturonate epimerase